LHRWLVKSYQMQSNAYIVTSKTTRQNVGLPDASPTRRQVRRTLVD
jgi:hypothetical protein